MRLMPARRQARATSTLPVASSFDTATGCETVAVTLPSRPGPLRVSHSVQSEVHPNLIQTQPKPMHPLRVAVIPDGRLVTTSGAVITATGHLVMETLWDRFHWQRVFDPPPKLMDPVRVEGRVASIVSSWCHNYHHWLFEALPRLAVLEASGLTYDRLIVPNELSSFHHETLALIGIPPDRLVPHHNHHIVADELIWASPLAPFEQPSPLVVDWLRHKLGADEVYAAVGDADPGRRLYLSRRGVRKVANEAQLIAALAPLGFEVVDPDRLSVAEQVKLFAESGLAIGGHGAAFSNAIFSRQMTLVELYHSGLVNASTLGAATAASHTHWSLMCRRTPSLRRRRYQDLRAPIGLILETLERAGEPTG